MQGDARNHIIQRKRLQLTDARDKLVKIAKSGDARDKINSLTKRTVQPLIKVM